MNHYLRTVRPLHLEFVKPNIRFTHIIVPDCDENWIAMAMIISRIQAVLTLRTHRKTEAACPTK